MTKRSIFRAAMACGLALNFGAALAQGRDSAEPAASGLEEAAGRAADADAPPSIIMVIFGDSHYQREEFDAALEAYEGAHAMAQARLADRPGDIEARRDIAHTLDRLGNVAFVQGRGADAYALWTDKLEVAQGLLRDQPDDTGWISMLAETYLKLAGIGNYDRYTFMLFARTALAELESRDALDAAGEENLASVRRQLEEVMNSGESSQDPTPEFDAGDYAGALEKQGHFLAITHSAVTTGVREEDDLADALGSHAWYAIFAGEYEQAEAAARQGLDIAPDQIWIATNLAHALMFQDRLEEADAIYEEHRGETIAESDNKTWETVIAEDFALLRERGFDHPHMDVVLARLAE